jgi:dCMP deaminase
MTRPKFDRIWLTLALDLAERSTCSRAKVGCVVVSGDNQRVLALGYNGSWKGGPNACDRVEPGNCGCVHSEQNALVKLNYDDPAPRKLYTTDSPCETCAKLIVNARIGSVTYLREYRKTEGLEILEKAGVALDQMVARDLRLDKDGQV